MVKFIQNNPKPDSQSENIWFPEDLYNSWLGVSIVLMTTALLFYHMTKKKSLEISPKASAIIAISFMLLSITIIIGSLIPYYQRVSNVTDEKNQDDKQNKRENHYKIFYTIIGSIFIFIEILVCIFIVKGLST